MTKLTGEKLLMRIHINENYRHGRKLLYEALMDLFISEGLSGATVIRGIAGFGVHTSYHTERLLDLSSHLPVIVEVIASQEKIDQVMPQVDSMMQGGIITLEKVTVVRYCGADDQTCTLKEP